MYLKHINLLNYKNLRQVELEFVPGINCFVGLNGSGKTNLLDAIYYMSFCKSYFNPVDSQLICHGEDFFMIQAAYDIRGQEEEFYAGLKRSKKKQFKRNKKEYQRLSDHIGLIPLVMISPGDEGLITDGSEHRRKFIDGVISQLSRTYLQALLRYNRCLAQRNALIKHAGSNNLGLESQLEVWDEQLAILGNAIFQERSRFIGELEPVFLRYYQYISDSRESVSIQYDSHHHKGDIREQLIKNRNRDLALGYTTKGVHRDDLELMLGDNPVRRVGSQGQKKSFVMALKLAQYEFIAGHCGAAPLLLLDDMFDKLDDLRAGKLIELMGNNIFKQVFITDTQRTRLVEIVEKAGKDYCFFNVSEGSIISDL
ncbi:DNA replication/repair protein RecF [Xiashengella succiniciproducens]|jgi:DNA replication and repair protein RecF|uniref:DNA replication and repair protein RecF n=1 Tax=Xiashengella succiniciproducens TaxID=2949635 RepID=A0A9J6ZLT4_9BACT|nr:DNA replication/repair protein RecF [Alkaliflexus sp. Ai-910]MDI9538277.1 DNA replication/repair protein RecF [Bacteroidota bacterium]URW78689.1 DNA replication/repair protein RecF [Alkaliflexus sp. Ai-910]HHU00663.1 DNA replication/repair protein RecF [Bacteroidales bacterium]